MEQRANLLLANRS